MQGLAWRYFKTMGCTGQPARKAPDLNGSRNCPFVVVPCRKALLQQVLCVGFRAFLKTLDLRFMCFSRCLSTQSGMMTHEHQSEPYMYSTAATPI